MTIEQFDDLSLLDKDPDLLDKLEIKHIQYYKEKGISYNIDEGGKGGHKGLPLSEERKREIGERNRQLNLGKKASEETKRKMSASRKGRFVKTIQTKLTPEIVKVIKTKLVKGQKASAIAKELDVDYKLINNIISNNTWAIVYVQGWDEFRENRKTYQRLHTEDHIRICQLHFLEGFNKYQIAEMYQRDYKTIEYILRKHKSKVI